MLLRSKLVFSVHSELSENLVVIYFEEIIGILGIAKKRKLAKGQMRRTC